MRLDTGRYTRNQDVVSAAGSKGNSSSFRFAVSATRTPSTHGTRLVRPSGNSWPRNIPFRRWSRASAKRGLIQSVAGIMRLPGLSCLESEAGKQSQLLEHRKSAQLPPRAKRFAPIARFALLAAWVPPTVNSKMVAPRLLSIFSARSRISAPTASASRFPHTEMSVLPGRRASRGTHPENADLLTGIFAAERFSASSFTVSSPKKWPIPRSASLNHKRSATIAGCARSMLCT